MGFVIWLTRSFRIGHNPTITQQAGRIRRMDESTFSRQRRLQLLVQQNRGRTDFKTYVEELASLLNMEISDPDRLDLEATDQLFAAHTKGCQESMHQPQRCFQKSWPYEPTEVWSSECVRIGGALRGVAGVLFVGPYDYCGAIRVVPEQALKVARLLLDFDGDALSLGALDGCAGLYLDKFEEHSNWFVELVVWGDWARLIPMIRMAEHDEGLNELLVRGNIPCTQRQEKDVYETGPDHGAGNECAP